MRTQAKWLPFVLLLLLLGSCAPSIPGHDLSVLQPQGHKGMTIGDVRAAIGDPDHEAGDLVFMVWSYLAQDHSSYLSVEFKEGKVARTSIEPVAD